MMKSHDRILSRMFGTRVQELSIMVGLYRDGRFVSSQPLLDASMDRCSIKVASQMRAQSSLLDRECITSLETPCIA